MLMLLKKRPPSRLSTKLEVREIAALTKTRAASNAINSHNLPKPAEGVRVASTTVSMISLPIQSKTTGLTASNRRNVSMVSIRHRPVCQTNLMNCGTYCSVAIRSRQLGKSFGEPCFTILIITKTSHCVIIESGNLLEGSVNRNAVASLADSNRDLALFAFERLARLAVAGVAGVLSFMRVLLV